MMKAAVALVTIWMLTGLGAVAGSILGNAAGKSGLFAGAVVGGAALAYLAPQLCTKLGWIARGRTKQASLGAVLGFLLAAPIAATNLHTPVIPVLMCSLAGIGALIGLRRGL